MRKKYAMLLAVMVLVGFCLPLVSCSSGGYTVGICQQMPHAASNSAAACMKQACRR